MSIRIITEVEYLAVSAKARYYGLTGDPESLLYAYR